MNVPPAPESMMAVASTVFLLSTEKIVMGTRNSFFRPTVLVYSKHVEDTDVEAVFRFKNPSFQWESSHRSSP
jgi:hypothetical protein